MHRAPLLAELRCEELPPAQVWHLARSFPDMLLTALAAAGFADGASRRAMRGDAPLLPATPRRFAALLNGVLPRSADAKFFRRGPLLAACRDKDGAPTRALTGFMNSVGATCESALTRVTEKGREYVAYEGVTPGASLSAVLADIVEKTLLKISAPRLMRWGDNEFKFIRPLRGVLLMHGDTPITSGAVFGVAAAAGSVGHPVLAAGKIAVGDAAAYEDALAAGGVIADLTARRAAIIAQFGDDAPAPAELLDEVAAMCEQPAVYAGAFAEEFLRLPPFCIEECLHRHQRAFTARENGALTARYRVVADNRPPNPRTMLAGFNAVMTARLRDVAFYFSEDKKLSADDALRKLEAITYHAKLGDQRRRLGRLCAIADAIGARLRLDAGARDILRRAAAVCKSDLPTLMIGEYPRLEGRMAAAYFCDDETRAIVACHNARDWRAQTAAMADARPAYALILANHLEKLVAMFGIGEKPSGSKDPHGLRFAAAAAAAVQRETGRALPLDALVADARAAFGDLPAFAAAEVCDFIIERARHDLLAGGRAPADALNAVLAARQRHIIDIEEKAAALAAFMRAPEAAALIAANKRAGNILRKSAGADAGDEAIPDESLFQEAGERDLHAALCRCRAASDAALARRDYAAALRAMAAIKPATDAFFDNVMVNAEDAALRRNRFALLSQLRRQLNAVGDLSALSA